MNSHDTAQLSHHQPNQRETCTLRPSTPSHLPLKCFAETLQGALELLKAVSHLISLHGLAVKLCLLLTPTFQFGWPHGPGQDSH